MKAAVLFKTKSNLKIIDNLELPILKRGQVLVKIIYTSLCRSQIMEIEGKRGKDKFLPHCLGHEASAKIMKVGKGVKKVKVSDFVVLTWIKCKGIDVKNTTYKYNNKQINAGSVTTFSTYSIVSENRVVKLPKNLNKKYATLFGCAVPTGCGLVSNQIKYKYNKSIIIIGMGGIGIFSLIAAKYYKFKKITVIDIDNKKLKYAKNIGAEYTLNFKDKSLISKIKNITNNLYFDYAIDTSGNINAIEMSLQFIKNEGTVIFASHPEKNKKIKIDPFELIKGKKIFGSWGGGSNPDRDINVFNNIIRKSNFNFKKYFSKEYSLNEINLAISDFNKGKVLRPIINMRL